MSCPSSPSASVRRCSSASASSWRFRQGPVICSPPMSSFTRHASVTAQMLLAPWRCSPEAHSCHFLFLSATSMCSFSGIGTASSALIVHTVPPWVGLHVADIAKSGWKRVVSSLLSTFDRVSTFWMPSGSRSPLARRGSFIISARRTFLSLRDGTTSERSDTCIALLRRSWPRLNCATPCGCSLRTPSWPRRSNVPASFACGSASPSASVALGSAGGPTSVLSCTSTSSPSCSSHSRTTCGGARPSSQTIGSSKRIIELCDRQPVRVRANSFARQAVTLLIFGYTSTNTSSHFWDNQSSFGRPRTACTVKQAGIKRCSISRLNTGSGVEILTSTR
mmetsp:Transcript_34448/g.88359  ORF Transcript_34448/g.88359 Transcript_34448/m.88359 type:complete len:335 (+) Transcript_34448:477-1481(+)